MLSMMRSLYPKKFSTCCAIARASSSFIPSRSIEFLMALVRSSTVKVLTYPFLVFVITFMRMPSPGRSPLTRMQI